ncbi:hypothetical protein STENM223S_08109 [Streptomyces tendae]
MPYRSSSLNVCIQSGGGTSALSETKRSSARPRVRRIACPLPMAACAQASMVYSMALVRGSTCSPEPDWASFIRSSASSGLPRCTIWRAARERASPARGRSPPSRAACAAMTKYFCAVGSRPTSCDIQPARTARLAATPHRRRCRWGGWW